MDETVQDKMPNATHPEPQFSINNVDSDIKGLGGKVYDHD